MKAASKTVFFLVSVCGIRPVAYLQAMQQVSKSFMISHFPYDDLVFVLSLLCLCGVIVCVTHQILHVSSRRLNHSTKLVVFI